MKKTYIMPAVTATAIEMQSLMTGSNKSGTQVYNDPTETANENEKGLSRRHSVWDDDEELAEEETGY